MTLGKSVLIGLFVLIAIIVAIPIFVHYLNVVEKRNRYDALINEGFLLVDDPNQEALDEAIRKGLDAKEIDPTGKEAILLLGRAYFLQGWYNKSVEELNRIIHESEAIDFFPEAYYHLALAYSNLYNDLRQQEMWKNALSCFSEAASKSGFHRADAFFGIGSLHFSIYSENGNPDHKEKAIINFQRCQELETHLDGYVQGDPESRCPHCNMSFRKKSEEDVFKRLLRFLTEE